MTPKGLLFLLVTLWAAGGAAGQGGIIHTLLRNNLAGTPDNFVVQKWEFDPDVAYRVQPEYRRLHGIRGEGFIERVGLGEDGHPERELRRQRERDRGVYVSRQPEHGP